MSQALALAPTGLAPRTALTSEDYVQNLLARRQGGRTKPLSTEAKMQRLALVLKDPNGIQRLGSGMIGPIMLKLRYQGMVRNVLLEDPVTPGTPVMYDVFDDLGQAYILSGTEGEIRVHPFEGKRVEVRFFRIASFPAVREEDLLYLRLNMVEQAQDESKQSIMKQEDSRLLILLQAALTAYSTRADHVMTPNHTVTETSGYFTPQSLYTAVGQTDQHELPAARVLTSPLGWRDTYRWDINQIGFTALDRRVAGEPVLTFGEFQIQRSIQVPTTDMWLLPDPKFLGVFPILQQLQVNENHQVEAFWKGWVMSEMVAMAIINPRGIAKIQKS